MEITHIITGWTSFVDAFLDFEKYVEDKELLKEIKWEIRRKIENGIYGDVSSPILSVASIYLVDCIREENGKKLMLIDNYGNILKAICVISHRNTVRDIFYPQKFNKVFLKFGDIECEIEKNETEDKLGSLIYTMFIKKFSVRTIEHKRKFYDVILRKDRRFLKNHYYYEEDYTLYTPYHWKRDIRREELLIGRIVETEIRFSKFPAVYSTCRFEAKESEYSIDGEIVIIRKTV